MLLYQNITVQNSNAPVWWLATFSEPIMKGGDVVDYKFILDDVNEKDEGTVFTIQNIKTGELKDIDTDEYLTLINKGELEI